MGGVLAVGGGGQLDLDGEQAPVLLDDQVDLADVVPCSQMPHRDSGGPRVDRTSKMTSDSNRAPRSRPAPSPRGAAGPPLTSPEAVAPIRRAARAQSAKWCLGPRLSRHLPSSAPGFVLDDGDSAGVVEAALEFSELGRC